MQHTETTVIINLILCQLGEIDLINCKYEQLIEDGIYKGEMYCELGDFLVDASFCTELGCESYERKKVKGKIIYLNIKP